ncbi:Transcriptional regulator RegR rpressor of hyaluronate and KDG utilization [Lactococcus cremoris]|uniref:Transcriptional regulator RegR rpressor of hyaluronate and KDG utilization n=1 Tax=Lactococcus lactis subsp. cremoris TaxID=1359 RepID=A0A166JP21_LACLC|nr:LacI family DNA-binding transcriptional regulator [Lactococcus cremoris]KZK06465.1 Transcriptional regulator RegR rpressor of hyaluronate and KDG utilization [Lactococcus cremoris]
MNKKVTINDIAKLTGVSKSTISNFLNGKFEGMSEKTRNRIQDKIKELDYRPNRQARALKSSYSSLIGISVTDISNLYTSRLLKGMMERLQNTKYHTIIMNSDLDKEYERYNIEKLLDEKVDGIIIQPLSSESTDYKVIDASLPIVQVDRYLQPLIWPAVVSDNLEQSQLLAEKIKEGGYQRIVVLTPPMLNSSTRLSRYEGIKQVIKGSKIEIEEIYTEEVQGVFSTSQKIWNNIRDFCEDDIKTVIYAFNGGLLYGVVKILNDKNISIPEQVGVVGYDDGALGELISPGLTSIVQDPIKIGYQAADLLVNNIESKKPKAELIVVESELKIRNSL